MATLTITLTEAVTLGDGSTDRGTTNVQTETVNEVDHRIMDIGTSYTEIMKFGSAASAGTFKTSGVQYVRITNLDSSANITLKVGMADSQYFVVLEPEDHFLLGNSSMDAHESGTTALSTAESISNIAVISGKSSSGTIQMEYFVASQD